MMAVMELMRFFPPFVVVLLLLVIAISVFGGGALLFVGARFAAKIPRAGYWKSVGVHVVSGLAGGLAGGLLSVLGMFGGPQVAILMSLLGCGASLAITWLVIGAMFHTTYGKAVLAWLPTLGQMVLVVPLLVAALMPGLAGARELARRASCKANVSSIGKAIMIYTNAYNDKWPPDLNYLIRDGQSPGIFVCPSTGSLPGPGIRDPGPGKFEYFYLASNSRATSDTIVLCDFKRNHKDGYRSILYADTHVGEARDDADFKQQLDQPCNDKFAKALRAAEGP